MATKKLEYWDKRKKMGVPKKIETPEKLWDLACDYFKKVDNAPGIKKEVLKGGTKAGQIIGVETMRPYTWEGLTDYCFEKGVIQSLEDYRYNTEGRYSEFKGIIRAINTVIFDRNFSGAAMEMLNPNLIARQLGMAEKTHMTVAEEQPLFGDDDNKE